MVQVYGVGREQQKEGYKCGDSAIIEAVYCVTCDSVVSVSVYVTIGENIMRNILELVS